MVEGHRRLDARPQALFALCEALDMAYMERRIREETAGDYGVQDLQIQT